MNSNFKIILGTVQLGLKYGINNSLGIPKQAEISKIFKIANCERIEMLDTAHVYGDSEFKIGECSDGNFNVFTKFSNVKSEEELINEFKLSLNNLRTDKLYGYMAHSADTLIQTPKLWSALQKLKSEGKIQKIGFSLYSPEQLVKLLEIDLIPDFVQLPYSLLDKKFDFLFPKLKKMGIEIHARSVFLQGLYFMNPEKIASNLLPLKPQLEQLHSYCKIFNVEIGSLALNFVISNPSIDKIVIGVESCSQLQQNINAIKSWNYSEKLMSCVLKLEVENKELLNPANW